MNTLQTIRQCRALLAEGRVLCRVRVESARGSVPRGPGAWMAIHEGGMAGTIGGGRLEFEAMAHARQWLASAQGAAPQAWVHVEHQGGHAAGLPAGYGADGCGARRAAHREDHQADYRDYPLGPALGQCCGGWVRLSFGPLSEAGLAALEREALARLTPVALFGGGHVGQALARLLTTLPFRVDWIDSRDDVFARDGGPAQDLALAAPNVAWEHSNPVQAAVPDLASGSHVLIMSYSHAEDFDITVACLERQRARADLPFIGLIGSRSKWAAFTARLRQRGFDEAEIAAVTCPIGVAGIHGKEPEVIAVAVAAQLLQRLPG